jgi:hypothetical protein
MQDGVSTAVSHIRNSIGYVGPDAIAFWHDLNFTGRCQVQEAFMINKAGRRVPATPSSAQAAVRSGAIKLLYQSSCPGFGLCAEIEDGSDEDVWPITAITVKVSSPESRNRSIQMLL